jgi:ketosteroid isomerase-like protein
LVGVEDADIALTALMLALPKIERDTGRAMSEENVIRVREGFDHFASTGRPAPDLLSPGFVWDMSNFAGWPEQQTYEGGDEIQGFLRSWTSVWDDWRLELDEVLDAGDQVVTLARQSGVSKSTGLSVEMSFAMVWSLANEKMIRMDMYSDRAMALRTAGLSE